MKTENFDDAIRRKLESINPQYTDSDIERVHKNVTAGNPAPSFMQGYGFAMAGLCAILIAGLLGLNFMAYRHYEALALKVVDLNKQITELKSGPPIGKAEPAANDVAANKNLNRTAWGTQNNLPGIAPSKPANLKPGNNEPTNSENANAGKNTPGKVANSNISGSAKNNNINYPINSGSTTNIASTNKGGNVADNNSNRSSISPNSNINNTTSDKNNNTANNQDGIVNNSKAEKQDNSLAENKNKENPTSSDKHYDTLIEDTTTDKVEGNVQAMPAASENIAAIKPPRSKNQANSPRPSHLNTLSYQAGIVLESARDSKGRYGIVGQVNFNKHWSAGTGLKMNFATQNFNDEDDFHHGKGKNFNDIYNRPPNDTFPNANIFLRVAVLEVPLWVSYKFPLSQNYSMVFTAGTDLDIAARQDIDFEHRGNIPDNKMMHIQVKNTPVLVFNNALISAGVQRQWGHITGQLSPYINPQLTRVDYKKDGLNAGIRLAGYYNF